MGKIIAAVITAFIGVQVYSWVTSIPSENLSEAIFFSEVIDTQNKRLNWQKRDYTKLKNSSDWEFLRPYAEKDAWDDYLVRAVNNLNSAKKIESDVIKPILERDHKDDIDNLKLAIKEGLEFIRSSKNESNFSLSRAEFILEARDSKDKFREYSERFVKTNSDQLKVLSGIARLSVKNHAHKKQDVNKKIDESKQKLKEIRSEYSILKKEYTSESTDFTVYADTYKRLSDRHEAFTSDIKNKSELLSQLDRSYVKVLTDQRIDYSVVIGRANWCENDGCYDGVSMTYPEKKVDADLFEYLDSKAPSIIAKTTSSWGSVDFVRRIPKARWDAIGIDYKYRWRYNYPYGEYWVDNTIERNYHQYSIIEDGSVRHVDMHKVSSDLYWKHFKHLGMAIANKPYGTYESEMITTPEPVGMATIAKPVMVNGYATGSNQYGQWRQSGGNSFWTYYGMYRLLGDFNPIGRRYSYADWSAYNQHDRGKPYYGRNQEHGTYGSATYSHGRYSGSVFSKRNPGAVKAARTGDHSKRMRSIRGASSSNRGKGPSGSGK